VMVVLRFDDTPLIFVPSSRLTSVDLPASMTKALQTTFSKLYLMHAGMTWG
jgi:hypothetical protein